MKRFYLWILILFPLYTQGESIYSLSIHSPLWEMHREWIDPLLQFIDENSQTTSVVYPNDLTHPIYHFTHRDAQEILNPLFQSLSKPTLSDETINKLFLNRPIFYKENLKVTPKAFFQTPEVKRELLRIAHKVHQITHGEMLLILGQTPAYLGPLLKTLDQENTTILHIPFSGRPNYKRKLVYKSTWATAFMDILTRDREITFRALLEQKGFSPQILQQHPKRVFIMDNSTGPSVGSFLAVLKSWFDEENVSLPEIIFLHLADKNDLLAKNEQGKWVPIKQIDLSIDETPPLDIPIYFLGMESTILVAFDKVHDNLRIVPSFNAIHWLPEYIEMTFPLYPTPEAKELMQEYEEYVAKNVSIL